MGSNPTSSAHMKNIYFIRHGESEGNIGPIRQTATTPLTEKGRVQAQFAAERCIRLPVDIIISSTMNRAKETSKIISEKISKPVTYSDLFVEKRRTSEELGKPKDDPIALMIKKETETNFTKPGWRFSDEENFDDLKSRALKALEYLGNQTDENILVVTHGAFLKILAACVILGENLTADECWRFIHTLNMENTGITVFKYNENSKNTPWKIWIWNDHTHLG